MAVNKVNIDVNHRSADINLKDASNNVINPAKEDGRLVTIDTNIGTLTNYLTVQSWDTTTTNLVTLTHSHDFIHDGRRFAASDTTALSSGSTTYYLLTTGTKAAHFVYMTNVDAGAISYVFEGAVVSGSGTLLAFNNRLRSSSATPLSRAYKNPTVTSTGTALLQTDVIGSSRGGSSPGLNRSTDEWVFKPSTNYLLQITATAAGTTNQSTELDIYETPA